MAEPSWVNLKSLPGERPSGPDPDRDFLSTLPNAETPRVELPGDDMAFLSELPDAPQWVLADPQKIQRSNILANTLDMPFSAVYDNEEALSKQMEEAAPGWFQTAKNSFIRGWGNTIVSAARAGEWAGLPKSVTDDYLTFGQRLRESYLPPMQPEEFTFDKLLDPKWWATTGVESVPPMLALIPAAIVGAYAGSGAAAAVGLGAFGKLVAGSIGGAALSRAIESAFEAGGTYEEAINRGEASDTAKERASFVFSRNMALSGVDAAQFALAFTPMRLAGGNANRVLARRVFSILGKTGAVGAMEAAEEAYQAGVQQLARGENMEWNAEMKEGAALGFVFGAGTGAAGSVWTTLTGRLENRMPPPLKEQFKANENAGVVMGLDPEEAKLRALDQLAETPEGRTFIEEEMKVLKDMAEGKEPSPLQAKDLESRINQVEEIETQAEAELETPPDLLEGILTDEDVELIASGEATIEDALGIEPLEAPTEAGEFFISDDAYNRALAAIKEKSSGLHAGIDPTILGNYVTVGAYHIERGVRDFAEWSKRMVKEFGEAIREHLESIWTQAQTVAQVEGTDDATQPAKQVKKQIRRTTGQERIVKMIREDVALAAAFKKAEQASRAAYKAGSKEAKAAAKAEFRQAVMVAKAKAEMFGFKEGFKVAEKLTRKEFIAAFKDAQNTTKATQKLMIEYINENLPPNMRGKFLQAIVNNVSYKRLGSVMSQVDALKEKLTRKELIEQIADLKEYKGTNIAVEYKKRLDDLLGDIDTKQISRRTLMKLSGLIDYAEREGMPSGVSASMRRNLERLEMRQAADMTTEELQSLVDMGNQLRAMGKLKQELRYKYNQRERERAKAALVKSTRNLDPKLTGKDTQADKFKAGAVNIYLETVPGQRVPEMLDGMAEGENVKLFRDIWNAEQRAKWAKRVTLNAAIEEIQALGIDELTEDQQVRMMINIRNMEGADQATLTLMEKFGYQEIPPLTEPERGVIEILRKYTNKDTDAIAALYEETKNEPFTRLDRRILPLKYEGEHYLSAEEAILDDHRRTTQTQQGFTIARKPGVKKMPRVDIFGIFEQAIDETQWYLHVQPALDNAARLVKTKEYIDAAGAAGANWWADHLDIVARRGWSATAHYSAFGALLRQARGNLGRAILGYKLSTIVMQPFAVIDAMAYAQTRWGGTAPLEILKEFTKAWLIPGVSKRTIEASKKLQMRYAGEPAIEEALIEARRDDNLKNRFTRNAMALIQASDVKTAAGVQNGIRNILERNGVENAAHEAELLMDMVSSSSDISFRPHILARGEGARTIFTFSSFFLNRWALIAHDLAGRGVIKGNWKQKYNAMLGLAIIIAGKIAEDEARKYLYEMTSGRELRDDPLIQDIIFALPSNIPIFGNIFDSASGSSGEIPLAKVIGDVFEGIKAPLAAKKFETKARAALRAVEAVAVLAGVPGTSQAFDLLESIFLPPKKKAQRVELAE